MEMVSPAASAAGPASGAPLWKVGLRGGSGGGSSCQPPPSRTTLNCGASPAKRASSPTMRRSVVRVTAKSPPVENAPAQPVRARREVEVKSDEWELEWEEEWERERRVTGGG